MGFPENTFINLHICSKKQTTRLPGTL